MSKSASLVCRLGEGPIPKSAGAFLETAQRPVGSGRHASSRRWVSPRRGSPEFAASRIPAAYGRIEARASAPSPPDSLRAPDRRTGPSRAIGRLLEMIDRDPDVQIRLEPTGVAHGITNAPGSILTRNSTLHQDLGCTSAFSLRSAQVVSTKSSAAPRPQSSKSTRMSTSLS